MSNFSATTAADPRGVILKLVGALDYEAVRDFERAADEVLGSKPTRVVIDAAGLTYLNSAGVGVVMKLQKRLKESSCELHMAAVTPDVLKMLRLCFLDRVLKIAPTVEAALGTAT